MALIGKIRENNWILLVVIGLAMLAFIFTEFSGGGGNIKLYPGEVYGKEITNEELDLKLRETLAQDQQEAANQGRQYTAQDEENSVEKAWNAIVEEKILMRELNALGINVSDKEAEAYLLGTNGFPVTPSIEQQFVDASGNFDRRALEQRIDQLKTATDPQEAQNWKFTIDNIKNSRMYEKYMQLLTLTSYVTTLEAEYEYIAQNEMKEVSFVGKSFHEIADDEITVKDEDIKKYYDAHKNDKKWENASPYREIKYFEIPFLPSEEDVNAFNSEMNSLKERFETSKNDSIFVLTNSDFKFYSKDHQMTFLPEGHKSAQEGMTYPANMDSIFRNSEIGTVVGPYNQGEMTRIAKIIDKNKYMLSARHILLSAQDSISLEKQTNLADSLVKLITKDNFEEYVQNYSQDPGSMSTGGKYEDFFDYTMVPEFSQFILDNPVGKIGYVKTQFGIHIIEVLKKEEVNYPVLAIIQKTLKPSEETESNTLNLAYDMIEKIDEKISKEKNPFKKVELFETIAKQNNYFVMSPIIVYDNSPKVNNFSNPLVKNNIIKFAFDKKAEVGTLGSVPYKADNRYVIAMLTAIKKKGVPAFEDVKELMRREVMNEMKAKRIASQLQGGTSLDAIAQKIGAEVESATITFANPQIGNLGYDAKAVGAIFNNLKDGAMTAPIIGDNGVYVFRIDKTTKAQKTENYEVQREQMLNNEKQGAYNRARQALYKIADPVDNRPFNQMGILRK